jgi:outer membrane receptor protein involved in Fe transport
MSELARQIGGQTPLRSGCTAAALSALGGVYPALAQPQLEVITVTAQRFAENIQDVPIAVSAVTAERISEQAIIELAQVGRLMPNVEFENNSTFARSTSVLSAYVRGIGQNDFAINFDPGVGVYLDGVYLARTVGANLNLLDIERIEVLKGPQGTLFGRNTIGGAINVVTRRPGDTFSWRGELTTGEFDRFDVAGSVDLPLRAGLSALIAFSSQQRDGYLKRIPFQATAPFVTDNNGFLNAGYATSEREGGQDEQTLRVKLLWTPSDTLELTVAADYTHVDQPASPVTVVATHESNPDSLASIYNLCVNTPAAVLNNVIVDATGYAPFNTTTGACSARATVGTALGGVNADANPDNDRLSFDSRFLPPDIDHSYSTGISFSELEEPGVAATADWQLTDAMHLKSISAYRELDWSSGGDTDGAPIEILEGSFTMTQHQLSQELHLYGTALSERLRWLLGAYYFDEGGRMVDYVTTPGGLLQVLGPNVLDTEAVAAFAHVNFRLDDRWGLTAGLRATHEKKEFEGGQQDLNGLLPKLTGLPPAALGFPDPANPLRFYPPGVNSKEFDDVSPRLGVEFHLSPDVMLYASYSEGFKSGGWTTRLSAPVSTAPDFEQENARSYELGWKSELFDRSMLLNAAVFMTEYQGIQLNFQQGLSPTIENAGDADIQGVELELRASPRQDLSIAAAVGYLDAEYTQLEPGVIGITLDSDMPRSPQWTINFNPRYTLPFDNGAQLIANASYTYASSQAVDTEDTPILRRPTSHNLTASIGYRASDGRWELALGGTNLTDDRYITHGLANIAAGVTFGVYNPPREWWLSFRIGS